ncbi:hypothetical protein [Plantactinospora soyae]|uniref:Uncharacterized protein n=1 Tax=Plantactinospora soyae TaxID=1544732 RepID=A0A927MFP2_9ACTN|nr:hypothetical protein [Plantactinospora soyae]MBE1492191.1 hypothetical protein [Plantactinospora soyae]
MRRPPAAQCAAQPTGPSRATAADRAAAQVAVRSSARTGRPAWTRAGSQPAARSLVSTSARAAPVAVPG